MKKCSLKEMKEEIRNKMLARFDEILEARKNLLNLEKEIEEEFDIGICNTAVNIQIGMPDDNFFEIFNDKLIKKEHDKQYDCYDYCDDKRIFCLSNIDKRR